MSEVYASFKLTFKKKNGKPDAALAKKVFDWCKNEYDWFLEFGDEGPFGIEDNVISTDPAFEYGDGFCIKHTLDGNELEWCETIYNKFKPGCMEVKVFSDASECRNCMTKKSITAIGKDGHFTETSNLVFDEFDYYSKNWPFAGAPELEASYAAGFAYDSYDGYLLYRGSKWGVVELAFEYEDGTVENYPITIDGNGDLFGAVQSDRYFLKCPLVEAFLDASGHPIRKLTDLDYEKTIEKNESLKGVKFLGIIIADEKKPIVLKAWKKNKKRASAIAKMKPKFGSFTDPRDGQVYKTVKIGNQVWLAENLRYKCKGAYAFENNEANVEKYGRLYTWEAAKKCAPPGWHLPSEEEWNNLQGYVEANANAEAGTALKSRTGWKKEDGIPQGTDELGFCALPAGFRIDCGDFIDLGENAYFCTSTENDSAGAYGRSLGYNDEDFGELWGYGAPAYSVRLLRD